jgi:drug/metabolite transporter (DMT)-like permease
MNAIAYTLFFILVKPLMNEYPPLHVIRWVFTFGFVMILPFGYNQFSDIQWPQFEWPQFISLFSIVIFGTFLAYLFNAYGLRQLGAGVTGSYIYTQPVFTAVIATLFLHEIFTIEKLVAGLMIFTGVFLVSRKGPPVVME